MEIVDGLNCSPNTKFLYGIIFLLQCRSQGYKGAITSTYTHILKASGGNLLNDWILEVICCKS